MTSEEDKGRAFYITHQKVALDLDFSSKVILCTTELQLYFNNDILPYIRLHSKACEISTVYVNNLPARFEVFDPCKHLCETYPTSLEAKDPDLFQKLFEASRQNSDFGELAIEIPKEVKLSDHLSQEMSEAKAKTEGKPEIESSCTSPLYIRIDYTINNPQTGIIFSSNSRVDQNNMSSYLYTLNQLGPGDARYWVPTIDEAKERFTWELDFLVKRNPERPKSKISVIASGVQVQQNEPEIDETRLLVQYFVAFPCPAYLISFSIGYFDSILLADLDSEGNDQEQEQEQEQDGMNAEENDMAKQVVAYAPIGWKEELRHSTQTVEKTIDFYISEFGSYPLDSLKLVFLQTSNIPLIIGAEVIIISLEFLHSEEIIDQTFETRRMIAQALASQWFGVNIVPKDPTDIWIILGFAGFMTSLFLKSHFGFNEYRYRMKQDMIKITQLDVERPPLYNLKISYPYDPEDISFIRLKGSFIMYMLDKQMLKGSAAYGLHRFIPKLLMSAMVGELGSGNTISTHWFLKSCRKLSGVDLKVFAEQWIFSSGVPIFSFSYSFNRKKMIVEIDFKQETTNSSSALAASVKEEIIKPAKYFAGNLTACIQEPDGTPYEHVLEIQEDSTRFEVQFNTKYKRIRRNTKRFQKRKAEAAAAEAIVKDQLEGDNPEDDVLFLTEEGNEKEKEAWRIVEWGEADEESLESATFEWIRLDSDFEWICVVKLEQPDYMWAGQLEKDRDVVSQYEAVEALKRFPSQATSTTLLRTVMNSQCFYRIRADAARALVYCSLEQFNYIGRHHLLRIYHKKFCIDNLENEKNPEKFLVKPNDFSSFTDYFVQKALVTSISLLEEPSSDRLGQKLILNLLKNNDNSNNPYSDSYYISVLISAIGELIINDPTALDPTSHNFTAQGLITELKRYSTMDHLIPSYHNVATVSCIQVYLKLFIAKILPPDIKLFMKHSRYGNFLHVRMSAFDGLLLIGGLMIPTVRNYLFQSLEYDPEPYIRFYLSVNLARVIALYQSKIDETISITEDDGYDFGSYYNSSATPLNYSKEKWTNFLSNQQCKDTIWRMLLNPYLDPRMRNSFYIICRLIYPISAPSTIKLSSFKIRIFDPNTLKSQDLLKNDPESVVKEEKKTKTVKFLDEYESKSPNKLKDIVNDSKGTVINLQRPKGKGQKPHKSFSLGHNSPPPIKVSENLGIDLKSYDNEINVKDDSPNEDSYISIISPPLPYTKDNDILIVDQDVSISPIEDNKPLSPPRVKNNSVRPLKVNNNASRNDDSTKISFKKQPKIPLAPDNQQVVVKKSISLKKEKPIIADKLPKDDTIAISISEPEINIEDVKHSDHIPLVDDVQPISKLEISTPLDIETTPISIKLNPLTKNSINQDSDFNPKPTSSISINPDESSVIRALLKKVLSHNASSLMNSSSPAFFSYDDFDRNLGPPVALDFIKGKVQKNQYKDVNEFHHDIAYLYKALINSKRLEKDQVELLRDSRRVYRDKYTKLTNPVAIPGTSAEVSNSNIEIVDPNLPPEVAARQKASLLFRQSKESEKAKSILKILLEMPESEALQRATQIPLTDVKKKNKATLPVDLKGIKYGLKKGGFISKEEVYCDLKLMLNKAFKYLISDSKQYKDALKLKKVLETEWNKEFPGELPKSPISAQTSINTPTPLVPKRKKEAIEKPIIRDSKEVKFDVSSNELLFEYGIRLVKKLDFHPSSPSFRLPVDPVAFGIPTYFDVVKEPMDLRRIGTRLNARHYSSFKELDYDIRLLTSNAYSFNQPGSWVYQEAKSLDKYYKKITANFYGLLTSSQYNSLIKIMENLLSRDFANSFKSPFEPTKVMKPPIDLDTIDSRIKNKYYTHVGEFEEDFIELLHITYSFYNQSNPHYENALSLEKFLVEAFNLHFPDRTLQIGKLSQKEKSIFINPAIQAALDKILKKLMANKASEAFLNPVDIVALNIPNYPQIIKQPIDFGTIKKRLHTKYYKKPEDMEYDIRLIFTNCYNFNGLESYYSLEAQKLEAMFNKEWAVLKANLNKLKDTSKDVSSSTIIETVKKLDHKQINVLKGLLNEIKAHQSFYVFAEPVDYVALQIPSYLEIIKHPMDFGTMRRKLDKGQYNSVEDFLKDAQLIFSNCFTFNYPNDPVSKMGREVQSAWQTLLKKYHMDKIVPMAPAPTTHIPGKLKHQLEDGNVPPKAKNTRR